MPLTPSPHIDQNQPSPPKGGVSLWRALDRAVFKKDSVFAAFARRLFRKGWSGKVALALIIAIIISGFATYAALSETPPFGDDPHTVIWLLNINLVLMALLVALIGRRVAKILHSRRQGVAGSKLQMRLVVLFSIMAAAPAIIMAIFSTFFFHFGVQAWFSDKVRTAVVEAEAVAESYLAEHQQVIKADVLAMANDLDRQSYLYFENRPAFERYVETQSFLRNLSEVMIFDGGGRILSKSGLTFTLAFEDLPTLYLEQARDGEVVIMTGEYEDRVRALLKLNNFPDAYLFVGRMVDPVVLSHLTSTRDASSAYHALSEKNSNLMVTITMIFIVVALMFLLVATWFGILLARQLVTPIGSLITAADRVRGGDLTARVEEGEQIEEFDYLAKSFNRMTHQIQEQRDDLITANRQLDHRRRFTETVLRGVSAGVLRIDQAGIILLANVSAAKMLDKGGDASSLVGQSMQVILPDIAPYLEQAATVRGGKIIACEIAMMGVDGARHTFMFHIVGESGDEDAKSGAVITFEDITELQSAQRKAAWADVARRIAHEIKNPLTPIQLSAERLKRKYLKEITSDPQTFAECTDTIIHHVGDIGRMVNEFSDFARMPEPVMKPENLILQIRQILALQKEAYVDIDFTLTSSLDDAIVRCDLQQVRQAFINLLQNAVDSVREKGGDKKINILLAVDGVQGFFVVCVSDNGLGLPKGEDPTRLTEPYITHKAKGTGLGLAIVKKIMEDHNGKIVLGNTAFINSLEGWVDLGGAHVALLFPYERDTAQTNRNDTLETKAA